LLAGQTLSISWPSFSKITFTNTFLLGPATCEFVQADSFYTSPLKSKNQFVTKKNAASAITWAVPDAGASLPASEEAGQSTDDAV